MITFLPYSDFRRSAESLDKKRLGNQRAEALWIAKGVIKGNTHPVVHLWHGWLKALIEYGKMVCTVWRERGYTDDMWPDFYLLDPGGELILPKWLGSWKLHSSHRANLIRKEPKIYRALGWTETLQFTYFWPKPRTGMVLMPLDAAPVTPRPAPAS